MEIGRGGAILCDNNYDYVALKRMAYDGRNLNIKPWQNQAQWSIGYHYNMRLEDAAYAAEMLRRRNLKTLESQVVQYPDVSVLNIEV